MLILEDNDFYNLNAWSEEVRATVKAKKRSDGA